jgi:hypothetical protein
MRLRGDNNNNTALGNLDNVIAERFRHGVQGQGAIDQPLNEFETAYCPLLVVIDDAKTFPDSGFQHELHSALFLNASAAAPQRQSLCGSRLATRFLRVVGGAAPCARGRDQTTISCCSPDADNPDMTGRRSC